jgi:putative ABC transport system permease protein
VFSLTFFAAFRLAVGTLLAHKTRAFLTSVGIIIGISAVIAMVSAGDGVEAELQRRLEGVGKNMILIRAGARTKSGTIADAVPLTRADAEAVRKQVGHMLKGVAEEQVTQRTATTRTANWPTVVIGTTPDMQAVRDWPLVPGGRFLTKKDVDEAASVCVIGETVRKKLFGTGEAVGQVVRVDPLQLHVVGVLTPKGRDPLGTDQDDAIFVPITTLQNKLVGGEEKIYLILTAVHSESQIDQAKEEITHVLQKTHHVKPGSEDFDVSSVKEMAALGQVVMAAMTVLVAVIASLSLLVGGIGIMNIMLVSVTERTREIGIRMAIGATSGDVLTQFLVEAMILSLMGGIAGVVLGLAIAVALALVVGWPLVISPLVILLTFAVSGAVGVFFGFYPAWKASRLDPIEALRYE